MNRKLAQQNMKNHWLEGKVSTQEILVQADDKILEQMGKTGQTFVGSIKDAINNSIDSARRSRYGSLNFKIKIGYSFSDSSLNYIEIEDDAGGMDTSEITIALSPGARKLGEESPQGLSEHGTGFNHFAARFGKLERVITKKEGQQKAILVEDYRLGKIPVYYIDWDKSHGTFARVVQITEPSLLFTSKSSRSGPSQFVNKLCLELGADYRYFLSNKNVNDLDPKVYKPLVIKNTNLDLSITIEQTDIDSGVTQIKNVEDIWPLYSYGETKENKPHVEKIRFAQGLEPNAPNNKDVNGIEIIPNWEVWVVLGFAPFFSDLDLKEKFGWYHPFGNKAGFDIFVNGVSILNTYSSSASNENKKTLGIDFHGLGNSWLKIRGEIHLSLIGKSLKFETTTTKDGVLPTAEWKEFTDMFDKWLKDSNIIQEQPKKSNKEFESCDEIYNYYLNMIGDDSSPLGYPIKKVIKGYTQDLPGYPVDLTVVCEGKDDNGNQVELNFPFEIKGPGVSAGTEEVMQPLGYYFQVRKLEKKLYLVAESLTPQGDKTLKSANEDLEPLGIKIIHHTLSKYGIK